MVLSGPASLLLFMKMAATSVSGHVPFLELQIPESTSCHFLQSRHHWAGVPHLPSSGWELDLGGQVARWAWVPSVTLLLCGIGQMNISELGVVLLHTGDTAVNIAGALQRWWHRSTRPPNTCCAFPRLLLKFLAE